MDLTWYEKFFEGIVLELWRKAISADETRLEVEFLERHLGLQPGACVLDVPCGLGRHSIELAARGYRVTGVDVSPQMIEAATAAAAAAGVAIEWRHADMQDLAWEAAFDGGFCFGNSFGYLDVAGTRTFLQGVSRALKRDARFALDYGMAAESILPRFREREWAQVDDILFLEENRYHADEACIETTYTLVRGSSVDRRTGLHWVYTVRELGQLLREAGLAPEGVFRSLNDDAYELAAPLLLLVARKV